jgi:hypothetical protein
MLDQLGADREEHVRRAGRFMERDEDRRARQPLALNSARLVASEGISDGTQHGA